MSFRMKQTNRGSAAIGPGNGHTVVVRVMVSPLSRDSGKQTSSEIGKVGNAFNNVSSTATSMAKMLGGQAMCMIGTIGAVASAASLAEGSHTASDGDWWFRAGELAVALKKKGDQLKCESLHCLHGGGSIATHFFIEFDFNTGKTYCLERNEDGIMLTMGKNEARSQSAICTFEAKGHPPRGVVMMYKLEEFREQLDQAPYHLLTNNCKHAAYYVMCRLNYTRWDSYEAFRDEMQSNFANRATTRNSEHPNTALNQREFDFLCGLNKLRQERRDDR